MQQSGVSVLIPAYKPDMRLNKFIDDLLSEGFLRIVVVDDGGGPDYDVIFARCAEQGAEVIRYEANKGKGGALKTGLAAIMDGGAMPVITADCDGQHSPGDVKRMADVMIDNPGSLVLGTRDKAMMPLRSRVGNTITCVVLGLLTGLWINDTQTGLRGLPQDKLDEFSKLDGDHYEYEMNMLIKARQINMSIIQMVIDTIYIDDNKGSHFSTVRDSARIYSLLFKQIGKYIGSSMVSGIVEYIAFFALHFTYPEPLLISVVGSRVISSFINYVVNREVVFKSKAGKRSVLYFYLLVAAVLFFNYWIIFGLTRAGVPTIIAKPIADFSLFVVSYNVQQKYIFRDRVKN